MSYKENSFYQDILVSECFYVATEAKELVSYEILGESRVCLWSDKTLAQPFLDAKGIAFDKVKKIDVDRFVTYELDDIFNEGDQVLVNPTSKSDGDLVDVVKVSDELMSDLDSIRLKEFAKDVAKEDAVFGLSEKGAKQFALISDDEHQRPHIMPVWSIKSRAEKVRREDFDNLELVEIEGAVFDEWLDTLRDDDKAVAIDLKPGVVGTVVSAQKVIEQLAL
ncbi:DUF2750 domain-containing protein [Staphylococcus gallinarum]|jgi:hypothetical protein|uniref:DUF2750 domain-containing protein n=1 Tax=Staphylococcus gallinarum TaxID=1293 RepID=UPI000D1E3574|nr:DUF2750 domain-containing protein [Staphylococcus gallinarum]MCD8822253.1 DUF2750 domain-containing protein [Staphylococcus gallinarum]MCQ9289710.1 DUF2750 domain-containing protein [Staphylococcus gallinarum]MEB6243877.1 DUF2750 domain-containing protein [Staphylococcus gallinarum]MEB6296829.1 DUF2750 domain-containing protein [Staphylococcus gallinarum]PTL08244.1 DUF2750 domain-containing protein [Staphylococcus gallinarum]